MKRQLRVRPAGQSPYEQQPERLLAREAKPPRARIPWAARREVLLNPRTQRSCASSSALIAAKSAACAWESRGAVGGSRSDT